MIVKRTTGWIGIDVGTHCVKIAQVMRKNNQYRLVDAAVVPRQRSWLIEDPFSNEVMTTEAEISAAKSVAAKCFGRRAACCSSMAICAVATAPVEAESQEPDQESLLHSLAVPVETQTIIDYCLAANARPAESDAIVFAMIDPWVSQLVHDMRNAGLACSIVDALPLALARATRLDASLPSGSVVGALDWGYSAATLCVAQNGEPCFVRTLPQASLRHILQDLSQVLRIDENESHRLLMKCGN